TAPADPPVRVERHYLDGSLILVTRFETAEGAVELTDFISLWHGFSDVVRLVRGKRGRVSMRTEFILRFDYGAVVPWVERLSEGGVIAIGGAGRGGVGRPAPLRGGERHAGGRATRPPGRTAPLVVRVVRPHD